MEHHFSKLTDFLRFARRYEKSQTCFHALVSLASARIIFQLYVDAA